MRILLLLLTVVSFSSSSDPLASSRQMRFPWMENLVRLPYPEEGNSTEVHPELEKYPAALRPFINATAIVGKRRVNNTEDEVITDEDVADVDEDDESHKVNTAHYDGKTTTVTISTEAGIDLYQHWLDQAVSGLMAAVATKKLESVPEYLKTAHQTCAKDAKTVQAHAKCVVVLLDAEIKYQKWSAKFGKAKIIGGVQHRFGSRIKNSKRWIKKVVKRHRRPDVRGGFRQHRKRTIASHFPVNQYGNDKIYPLKKVRGQQPEEDFPTDDTYGGWVGAFKMRARRSVDDENAMVEKKMMRAKPVLQNSYNLLEQPQVSPLALLAKKLIHTVRTFKNKNKDYKSWQTIVGEIKEEGKKLKQKQKAKKMLSERFDLFKRTLRDEGMDKAMMKKMNVLDDDDEDDLDAMMFKAKEQEETMSTEDKMMQAPVKLIREGLKLGMMMTGRNVSNFDRQNVKLISPRLLSLVPEEVDEDTINLLSPSLLSLHNEGKGLEDDLSLSRALKLFDEHGHQEWLNFVIEASGVSEALLKMKDANAAEERRQMDEQFRGKDGQPLYFTKENVTEMYGEGERKKIEVFEELQRLLSPEQMRTMNTTGYVKMSPQQLEVVYGPGSPYHDPSTHHRLSNVSESEIPHVMDSTIRGLAEETIQFKAQRRKDIVLTPLVLTTVIRDPALVSQPLILSPVLFVPIVFSPAIFGAVILSPWAFVPVIISPRLMSPVIISPLLLSTVTLSPLAMDPLILSPGALAPFILSPLVLSPFILSPVALAPLILSPFCLSPFILIPNVLSPLILSPFVLSPLILSPVAFSAFVLTPYALSPVIASPGAFFSAVLSPTWLS
ncbi:hypothetical protein Y032_0012g1721 [Ancylostoma ceylanicum]|uniref:Uncharacterized protein n=2 Tax=Ancylostoma ceylanicum TaxID=53326 RepID=A0A016VEI6_9BILA|nr:hypothetical protein Y032_0012g1721 [Ancylostoma ceylanicum]